MGGQQVLHPGQVALAAPLEEGEDLGLELQMHRLPAGRDALRLLPAAAACRRPHSTCTPAPWPPWPEADMICVHFPKSGTAPLIAALGEAAGSAGIDDQILTIW